jgi:hypothetical protein
MSNIAPEEVDQKAKEIVCLLEGLSKTEVKNVLSVVDILLNQNYRVSVSQDVN